MTKWTQMQKTGSGELDQVEWTFIVEGFVAEDAKEEWDVGIGDGLRDGESGEGEMGKQGRGEEWDGGSQAMSGRSAGLEVIGRQEGFDRQNAQS